MGEFCVVASPPLQVMELLMSGSPVILNLFQDTLEEPRVKEKIPK